MSLSRIPALYAFALFSLLLAGLPAGIARAADSDGWISLFDGKSLAGWKSRGAHEAPRVVDGHIVAAGGFGLDYRGGGVPSDLRDFEFQVEVLTKAGGVPLDAHLPGLRTVGIRIYNSTAQPESRDDLWKTGSVLRLRPQLKPPSADGRWFTFRAVVHGRWIRIYTDSSLVADLIVPWPYTDADRRVPAALVGFTGRSGAETWLRGLRIRPLPAGPTARPLPLDYVDTETQRLLYEEFPLADFHIHLKGGLTLEEALAQSRQKGVFYGIAANCGIGFPIHDDRGAQEYLKQLAGQPCFVGMQAEGREWPRLVSKETIAKFDYIFTDAMTIIDHRGRRARLWIKEEVDIPDAQEFMERLVRTIEDILRHEPVDIYANPTYLPAVLAKDYDRLWTPERQRRVIRAAAENGVAIEISNSLRLPKPDFIQAAKAAGIRFTLGTNNTDRKLGREEYGLEMIRRCGLTWQDMWMPKPDGQKPVQVKKP
jgi:hypothetical protein